MPVLLTVGTGIGAAGCWTVRMRLTNKFDIAMRRNLLPYGTFCEATSA